MVHTSVLKDVRNFYEFDIDTQKVLSFHRYIKIKLLAECRLQLFKVYKYLLRGTESLYAKMAILGLQRYPCNLNLIKNVEDIVGFFFTGKMLIFVSFSIYCFL